MHLTEKDITNFKNRVAHERDEKAYEDLFFHYYPILYKFIVKSIPSPQDAEELTADILLRMWTMEARLANVNHLTLYLVKTAKNSVIDYYRRNHVKLDAIEEVVGTKKEPSNSTALSNIYTNELDKTISNTIENLPPKCRMVYLLIREVGLSHSEVSKVLEISRNTIESHMRNALKAIKADLAMYLAEGN